MGLLHIDLYLFQGKASYLDQADKDEKRFIKYQLHDNYNSTIYCS